MQRKNSRAKFFLCRLCNICGPHETDLFNGQGQSDELRKTISKLYSVEVSTFNCSCSMFIANNVLRLQVEETDESTKICATCLDGLNEYAKTREIYAKTNRFMQNSQPNDIDETSVVERTIELDADDVISVIDLTLPDVPGDLSVCISLLDSDSEAENVKVVADAGADRVRSTHPAKSEA